MTTPPQHDGPVVSGLRDPQRAVRGLAAGTMLLEGITLLLGIQPIRVLGTGLTGAAVAAIAGAAVLAFVLSGMMGRRWAWHVATGLQVALIAGGLLHGAVAAIGVIFGLAWIYVLRVRRRILG